MTRIRTLVDMAYYMDPRIRKFQQEVKDKKQAAKRAKQEAIKAIKFEEERVAREAAEKARLEREKREAEERAKQDALKQEREQQKKALRRERKNLRDLCKVVQYYLENYVPLFCCSREYSWINIFFFFFFLYRKTNTMRNRQKRVLNTWRL